MAEAPSGPTGWSELLCFGTNHLTCHRAQLVSKARIPQTPGKTILNYKPINAVKYRGLYSVLLDPNRPQGLL